MSEHEEAVPLTRRERRMRELAETGALNLSDLAAEPAAPVATPEVEDVEISPTNPDGSLRSRREIRELREQALAEREATKSPAESPVVTEPLAEPEVEVTVEPEAEAAPEVVAVTEPEAEVAAEPEAEVAAEPEPEVEPEVTEAEAEATDPELEATEPERTVPAEAAELPAEDFDYIISPPTEPFTVEELRAAETSSTADDSVEVEVEVEVEVDVEDAGDVAVTESDAAPEEEPQPEASGKSRLKFWKRNKGTEAAEEVAAAADAEIADAEIAETEIADTEVSDDAAAATVAAEVVTDEALVASEHIAEDVEVAPEATETETVEPEVEAQPEVEVLPEPVVVEAPVAAPETPTEAYSFPDIAPPEEWRSVFDDPATLNLPVQSGETQGDFDDLISRAVAQEGSTTSTGTSALILPTMPEDTGGLTGPLGATGELFVTGSMRLPKSLGETGGHVSLHDSTEIDPITGAETIEDSGVVAGPAPVSARHAVSARVVSGVPAVAKPTKERSKLPLVLGATGGGLVVVVAGLGIWGATQGFFG